MQSSPELDGILLAIKALGIPFLLSLAGSAWAYALLKKGAQRRAVLSVAVSVLLGIVGGYAAMNHDHLQFPPTQALDWLPVTAVLSLTILLTLELLNAGKRIWFGAQVVFVALATWLMLPPAIKELGASRIAMYLLVSGVVWLTLWRYVEGMRGGLQRAGVAFMLCAGALGFVVALGGSIVIGTSAISLMGALAGWLLVCVTAGWVPLPRALLGTVMLWFGSIVIAAYFYAEISSWLLATVVLGLLAVQLARLGPVVVEGKRLREIVMSGLATSVPLVMAIGFAVWRYLQQANAY